MPQHRRTLTISSFISLPSVNTYLTFSTFLFISGFYYYYRIISSYNSAQNVINYTNGTLPLTPPARANNVAEKIFSVILRHRLLFYILLNTCCAIIAFTGKLLVEGLFSALSSQEENLLKNSFRRFFQTKILFLVFISHHNLFEDILIWMPWLALQLVCSLLLELSSTRMSNPFDLVSNKSVRRRLYAANGLTLISSIVMAAFVVSIRSHINFNYILFLISDCCLLLVQSVHLLFKLFTIVDVNAQRGHLAASSSYYVDLTYDLIHDSIEFANYLHMIFFSHLAVTYCCVFLIVQAKHYYTRISTKIQKHWQHQEIVRHISACYVKASDEDLLKNTSCTICWQLMKGARKLPCGHMFHELCLRRWLEQDSSCAICRQPLSLNLNNVLRRGEFLGEDMDNAMQYLIEAVSPRHNRLARWWTQILLNEPPLSNEQVDAIVERVAEVFPNYDREVLANAARETGSVSGAVDLLLERAGGGNNQNAAINNEFDSSDEAEDMLNANYSTESETEADDDLSVGHAAIEVASQNTPSVIAESTNAECKIVEVTLNSSNSWFVVSARAMIEASRRKYLESDRGDDIRHLLQSSSTA